MSDSNKKSYSMSPRILFLQPQTNDSQQTYDLVRYAVSQELPDAVVNTINDLYPSISSMPEAVSRAIQESNLIIANMEGGNQSVYVALGMAVADHKPILLIGPSERALSVPTGLFNARLYLFSLEEPKPFIESFGHQIVDALEQKKDILPEPDNKSVFISYSHRDSVFLDRLMIHLRPLERAGLIDLWVDTHLRAGDDWQKEIEKALHRAKIAILLVSADFMASEFIVENELPPLLENARVGGTKIISLIVKPCRFARDKRLNRFQAVNEPLRPLNSLPESEQEVIYDKTALEIETVLGSIKY